MRALRPVSYVSFVAALALFARVAAAQAQDGVTSIGAAGGLDNRPWAGWIERDFPFYSASPIRRFNALVSSFCRKSFA